MNPGGTVLHSNSAGGSMEARIINDMLHRNEIFRGVKTKISLKGEGGLGGLWKSKGLDRSAAEK